MLLCIFKLVVFFTLAYIIIIPIANRQRSCFPMDSDNLQSSTTTTVKLVDFAPFLDGSDRQGVSNAILDSFKTTGFVYLVNHGLPQSRIDSMFSWVRPR